VVRRGDSGRVLKRPVGLVEPLPKRKKRGEGIIVTSEKGREGGGKIVELEKKKEIKWPHKPRKRREKGWEEGGT